jgi:hypothetical protein
LIGSALYENLEAACYEKTRRNTLLPASPFYGSLRLPKKTPVTRLRKSSSTVLHLYVEEQEAVMLRLLLPIGIIAARSGGTSVGATADGGSAIIKAG